MNKCDDVITKRILSLFKNLLDGVEVDRPLNLKYLESYDIIYFLFLLFYSTVQGQFRASV